MTQRVKFIDGMRGFSLLGILMANMLIFQYGMFGKEHIIKSSLSVVDQSAYIGTKIFIENSFIPIFMFLFGYSMIKLKEKLEMSGQKVTRHFVRRFFLLIAIGLLHSSFIWEGDILFAYGLMGLFMLLFLNRKKKTILIWAILLGLTFPLSSYGANALSEAGDEKMTSYIEKEHQIYSTGSYAEIYEFRKSSELPFDIPDYFYLFIVLLMPLMFAPMFLLGIYAGKNQWFSHPKRERKRYVQGPLFFLPFGIALKCFYFLFPDSPWSTPAYDLGATVLSIGYIFTFALLYTKERPSFLLLLEKAGRLSMSNYLTQSIICTTIFYSYGLGLFAKMGVFYGLLLAVAIFTIQLMSSHFYLKRWKMGPFEKLFRIAAYITWSGTPRKRMSVKESA